MKTNSKDKSLAKKVLLSVVAAGVMSGFVLSAEAADSTLDVRGEKVTKENVQVAKVVATGGAELTLKGGTVSGLKENRSDPDDPEDDGMIAADVATEIVDKGTVLNATNVAFTGEVAAVEGSKIIINGGSVTAGNCYYDAAHGNKIEKLGTEIGAHDGSEIELNKVVINSNLGAFDGGVITVNDSNVHAANAIYAEGKGTVINLNSSDGKAEYTVASEYGIEANEGSSININGGKVSTTYFVSIKNSKITVNNTAINASNGIWADNSVIILDGEEKTTYTVGEGFVAENSGKIYINGGTLQENNLKSKMYNVKVEEGLSNTDAKGIVLDKNGVISTMSDQIYANKASETQKESGAITNEGIDFKGGKLVLNDAKYTLGYSQTAQAELVKQGATKLTMAGEMVEDSGETKTEITVDEASNAGSDVEFDKVTAKADKNLLVGSNDDALIGQNIAGITVGDKVENGFAVGKLDLGDDSDGVIITNDKSVTLGGSAGGSVLTVNGADKDVKVVLGTDAGIGNLNIGNSLATAATQYKLNGEVIVNKGSNLNVTGQTEITKSLTLNDSMVNVVAGALKTKELDINGYSSVFGAVNAEKLDVAGGLLEVGYDDAAGSLTVDEAALNGGMIFLDPAWKDGATINDASGMAVKNITAADGAYVVGRNSVLSLGADLAIAKAAFAKSEQTWGENAISAAAYIDSTLDVTNGSLTVDGALETAPTTNPANGSVKLADKSILMVNGSAINETTAALTGVSSADIAASSKLYIDNAEKDKTYKIIDGAAAGWSVDNIISNNKLLNFTVNADNTVSTTSKSVKDAYGSAVFAADVYDAAVLAGEAAADFVAKATDEHVNASEAAQVSALNSAAALSELAGVEHGTYAASNLFTDAVAEHMSLASEKEHDSDIWAKYIHSKDKVDGLEVAGMTSKYDATYNGIVVGADLYKNSKAAAGVALTYVDGSIKGNTLAANTKNDATYYGASIYGAIQNDDSAVIGDISYLHGKNDITQHNSGSTLTADAKSDAFSVGVRAEKSLKSGVGRFVPYAGLRYMHLGTGNYTNSIGMSYDSDDMNLWLLPIGVKYSADVKAGGWTLRPIAEVGYVWNMGDRDATQTVSLNGAGNGFGFDVADSSSYIGRFAIEAEKANVTYGLGYEYQKGDSVKTNKWMANLNWSF